MTNPNNPTFSADDDKKILRMFSSGRIISEISRELGVGTYAITNRIEHLLSLKSKTKLKHCFVSHVSHCHRPATIALIDGRGTCALHTYIATHRQRTGIRDPEEPDMAMSRKKIKIND